jgi:hypothetical protein
MFHTEKVSRYNMICFFTVLDQFPIIAVLEYFVEYVVKFSAFFGFRHERINQVSEIKASGFIWLQSEIHSPWLRTIAI